MVLAISTPIYAFFKTAVFVFVDGVCDVAIFKLFCFFSFLFNSWLPFNNILIPFQGVVTSLPAWLKW